MDEKIIAIIAIALLGGLAICLKLDGMNIAIAIAAIAGLAGFKPSSKS